MERNDSLVSEMKHVGYIPSYYFGAPRLGISPFHRLVLARGALAGAIHCAVLVLRGGGYAALVAPVNWEVRSTRHSLDEKKFLILQSFCPL